MFAADMMSRKRTGVLLFLVGSALISPEFSPIIAQEVSIYAEEPGVMLAQAKKRKKKKKKRKKKGEAVEGETTEGAPVEEGATPADGSAAGGGHGAQEKAGLYKWQVSLLSDFKIVNQQTGDAKSGSGNYDLDVLGLYV